MTPPPTELSSAFARALSGDFAALHSGTWTAPELLAAANDHGIGPLLWEAQTGPLASPDEFPGILKAGVQAGAARDVLVQREIRRVLDVLADERLPVLVIKGAALAHTIYARSWLRPRTDTDLLIPFESVPIVARVLESSGYRRCDALSTGAFVSHQIAFERTDSHGMYHVIDVHWKVANPQVVADALPFEILWPDALPAPALGIYARVPSTVGSILLACIHRLAHHQGHERLIWLYDLKLLSTLLRAEDWAALRTLSCQRGVAGLCVAGLRAAHVRLGAPLPEDIDFDLAAAAPNEPSHMYVAGPVRKRKVLVTDLKALRTWGARLGLLREHVLPTPAFMRQRYGMRARWVLPALYLHRFVTGAYRWVRH